jgi:hypothetical protein
VHDLDGCVDEHAAELVAVETVVEGGRAAAAQRRVPAPGLCRVGDRPALTCSEAPVGCDDAHGEHIADATLVDDPARQHVGRVEEEVLVDLEGGARSRRGGGDTVVLGQ